MPENVSETRKRTVVNTHPRTLYITLDLGIDVARSIEGIFIVSSRRSQIDVYRLSSSTSSFLCFIQSQLVHSLLPSTTLPATTIRCLSRASPTSLSFDCAFDGWLTHAQFMSLNLGMSVMRENISSFLHPNLCPAPKPFPFVCDACSLFSTSV